MTVFVGTAPAGMAVQPLRLATRRLPARAPLVTMIGAAGTALAGRAALGWTGWMTTALASAALSVTVLAVWSAIVEGRRRAIDRIVTIGISAALAAAVIPLLLILGYIAAHGFSILSRDFLTHSMAGVTGNRSGGGVYHALIGTIQQVGLAAAAALPLGILTAIFLAEFGRGRLARAVTFFVDVMNGVPSIVAGLAVFSVLLLGLGMRPFGAAGSVALAILMLPIVVRSAEEMIRLVPDELREASYALGVPRWRTIMKVVLPTALSGLVTGSLLAIARIIGETAPLILLVGYSSRINMNPLAGDQASLPVMIWDQLGKRSGNAGEFAEPRAWGAALVLVLLVLVMNISARLAARWLGARSARGRRHIWRSRLRRRATKARYPLREKEL